MNVTGTPDAVTNAPAGFLTEQWLCNHVTDVTGVGPGFVFFEPRQDWGLLLNEEARASTSAV